MLAELLIESHIASLTDACTGRAETLIDSITECSIDINVCESLTDLPNSIYLYTN